MDNYKLTIMLLRKVIHKGLKMLTAGFFVFFPLCVFSENQIEGIDSIYLINLDRRPDRLRATSKELAKYDLYPQRVSAIDGRMIPFESLIEIGVSYASGMLAEHWATTPLGNGTLGYEFLDHSAENRSVFSEWMSIGAIGCALSHISVLKDAYAMGYETIWVLEDDICVKQDPHVLTPLIEELDSLTQGQWDILYTDSDFLGGESQTPDSFWWMWRPDLVLFNAKNFTERKFVSRDFIQVGSRDKTHSMVIRRSGIKKILDHIEKHHLYLPIDHEIAFASNIQLFMTSYPIVTYDDNSSSDIQQTDSSSITYGTSHWELYKKSNLAHLSKFPGWCSPVKANHLMNFIYNYRPNVCVEIGTFGGSTTFPIILALKYLNNKHLFTIDAWNNDEAVLGLNVSDSNYSWWKTVDLGNIKKTFLTQLNLLNLKPWCTVLERDSLEAAYKFKNESIDLLYIDGNFSKNKSLQDVITYFPKVKKNGFIWLNDANSLAKIPCIAFLNEHAVFLREESLTNRCVVFQKK